MVQIRRYTPADEPGLYDLIRSEGNEWRGYWSRWTAYVQALDRCEVFVAVDAAEVCGYVRCIEDPGFGLHVIDLLVAQQQRGQRVGRLLLETAAGQFSGVPTYVHSDVDPYYAKQGYRRVGSLFQVTPGGHRG
jgi:ribosomal protein S18 acetylase RimI-like enzyme